MVPGEHDGEGDLSRLLGNAVALLARGGTAAALAFAVVLATMAVTTIGVWLSSDRGVLACGFAIVWVVPLYVVSTAAFALASVDEPPSLGRALRLALRRSPAAAVAGLRRGAVAIFFQAFGAGAVAFVMAIVHDGPLSLVAGVAVLLTALPYLVVGSAVHGEALIATAMAIRDGRGPGMATGDWFDREGRKHPLLVFVPGFLPLAAATATLGQFFLLTTGRAPPFLAPLAANPGILVVTNVVAGAVTIFLSTVLGVAALAVFHPARSPVPEVDRLEGLGERR